MAEAVGANGASSHDADEDDLQARLDSLKNKYTMRVYFSLIYITFF